MFKKRLSIVATTTLVALSGFTYSVNAATLQEVYEVAKTHDPIILKSKAKYDMYLAKVSQAKSALLPQIGFGLDAGYTKNRLETNSTSTDTSYSNYGANVSLTQSIYNGANWKQFDIAEKQATEFAAVYGTAAQDLLIRASTAYFDVLKANDTLASVKANKRAVERQLEQAQQRYDVGLIAITDVFEAQAGFDRIVADEINAQNTLDNAYYSLRELTGKDISDVSELDIEIFTANQLEDSVDVLLNKSLNLNLNLHAKRIAKEVSKMQISLAENGHLPTLDFTSSVNYGDKDFRNESGTDQDTTTGQAGIALKIPLYTGGKITSLVKQAQFSYVIASEDLIETMRSTEAQIKSGYNNVTASISSIKAYEQTAISSRSALEATEGGFDVGTRTIVDVLDATRAVYAAENLLANARYEYILNVIKLKFYIGTLQEEDIFSISKQLVQNK